ncbi:heterokaryon incompatibility protein-domain-containing protein [Achaetomium macrosporum]|uniref:Heterokaryon incompatibility protein-domain-containing protein n=1 Tax=Achaetomium macrosporum TaxID=79813 RepID=A0AAN7HDZ4_9PEZI|nr:heterokaryon incompatibility protein-domain-containing protein [Achaetomium macrosporum]
MKKHSPVVLSADSTTSTASLKVVRCWLDRCLESHKSCNSAGAKQQWYPSRLLRLDRSSAGVTVRLQECDKEPPTGPYVSLSHRWGGAKPMMLRTDNLSSMTVGVQFEDLSKTFQDAVDVTLNLGYHYLWIDSLCIIQDSKEDWLREASLMKEVYQNALFTISAANPRAPEEGLSSVRHSEVVGSLVHSVRWDTNSSEKRSVRITMEPADLWATLLSRAPITKRAWILQERILSHRILHFASSQLAWECDELEACELYPAGILVGALENRVGMAPRSILKPIPDAPSSAHSDGALGSAWHRAWLAVVEQYTRCSLSEPSDKLIALSGVANYYQAQLVDDNRYLAGLWQKTFVEELAWMRWSGSYYMAGCRAKEYRAPSWSWAAIDYPVKFVWHRAYDRALAKLIDVQTNLIDPANKTGGVRAGTAILRGKLTEVYWERDAMHHLDIWLPDADEPRELHRRIASWPDDNDDTPGKAYCLMLLQSSKQLEKADKIVGIVMAEVEQPDPSQSLRHFRRVGLFTAFADGVTKLLSRSQEATIAIV